MQRDGLRRTSSSAKVLSGAAAGQHARQGMQFAAYHAGHEFYCCKSAVVIAESLVIQGSHQIREWQGAKKLDCLLVIALTG